MYSPSHPPQGTRQTSPLANQPMLPQQQQQPIPVRQQIIESLFNKIGPDGQREETLIAHLKVWEDATPGTIVGPTDMDGRKQRYLMLAVHRSGKVYLHKAKRNQNMSFSKGKTWNLEDLRAVEVLDHNFFGLTMTTRTYTWQSERLPEQHAFLQNIIRVYAKYTRGKTPQLIGIDFQETRSQNPLSPTNMIKPLPAQQSLQPPSSRDRQDSQSSQGSGSASGSGSRAPSYRTARGSEDRSFAPTVQSGTQQDRGVQYAESRDSPFPAPQQTIQQNYSMQPQPQPQKHHQQSYQSSTDYAPSQQQPQHSQVASNTSASSRHAPQALSSLPQSTSQRTLTQGQEMPALVARSPSPAYGEQRRAQTSPQGRYAAVQCHAENRSAVPSASGAGYAPEKIQSSQIPSPPPEMMVEPPTPNPGGDVATMESMQAVGNKEGQGMAHNSPIQAGYRMDGHSPAPPSRAPAENDNDKYESGTNATKQRARLPQIVTATPVSSTEPKLSHAPKPPPVASSSPSTSLQPVDRRAHIRRASIHPPTQPSTGYSRDVLLRSSFAVVGTAASLLDDSAQGEKALEDETLANVEELLEGFDWGTIGLPGRGEPTAASATEVFERRLLDELNALEAANIHAFLESDDRIAAVLDGIDQTLLELESMDSNITAYKMHLGSVSDDIAYIESQNRGLQVQTANQRALLTSIEQLIQIVQVNPDELRALTQESLETEKGISSLERALSSLYKALLVGRGGGDMAAAIERTQEYETHNRQFCSRLTEYLFIMFKFQCEMALTAAATALKNPTPTIPEHAQLEDKLGKYCGLVLYMKEMDEERYQKLCANYFSSVADLHNKEVKGYLSALISKLKRPYDDDKHDGSFIVALAAQSQRSGAIVRSKTMMDNLRRNDTKKGKRNEGDMKASQAFESLLLEISLSVTKEEAFVGDFLHTSDAAITFADYMDMEFYFRRQASTQASQLSPATLKLRRSAMDLIFGFLDGELQIWIEGALQKEPIQVFGMMAACEKIMIEQEDTETVFFANIMQFQAQRLQQMVDKFMAEQIRAIEATKLTVKKRKGVTIFIRHFPTFVERIEQQLVGANESSTRDVANAAYEQVVNTMLETLQHMAKLDRTDLAGTGDDKGQLNYFIIMIENMHAFVGDISKLELAVLNPYLEKAQVLYNENMNAYITAILRRSFGKAMDFFDGVHRQLETMTPMEVTSSPAYNKSALKRAVKDISSQKELRKALEALAKRIEKHYSLADDPDFNDSSAGQGGHLGGADVLIGTVWTACERILGDSVRRWQAAMASVYADAAASGVGLEYGPAEVDALFKKLKPV